MAVQTYYTDHNTSPLRSNFVRDEIETLSLNSSMRSIDTNGGYISAALLARFDVDGGTFPSACRSSRSTKEKL